MFFIVQGSSIWLGSIEEPLLRCQDEEGGDEQRGSPAGGSPFKNNAARVSLDEQIYVYVPLALSQENKKNGSKFYRYY